MSQHSPSCTSYRAGFDCPIAGCQPKHKGKPPNCLALLEDEQNSCIQNFAWKQAACAFPPHFTMFTKPGITGIFFKTHLCAECVFFPSWQDNRCCYCYNIPMLLNSACKYPLGLQVYLLNFKQSLKPFFPWSVLQTCFCLHWLPGIDLPSRNAFKDISR